MEQESSPTLMDNAHPAVLKLAQLAEMQQFVSLVSRGTFCNRANVSQLALKDFTETALNV